MKNAKEAIDYLRAHTKWTERGIAALLGNYEAESNIEPMRVQGDFTAARTKSTAYAADVDSGKLTAAAFAKDGKGWGLAQWTYNTRKTALLDFCRSRGASIGDLTAQLDFTIKEMPGYTSCNAALLDDTLTIRQVSDLILRHYENPAVQTEAVKVARAKYGEQIYRDCHEDKPAEPADSHTASTKAELVGIIERLQKTADEMEG